jgi:hypothetical protein
MIDELSASLRDEQIVVLCQLTIGELRTYVRKENGRMSGSPHDDRVISLALANQMLKYVYLPEYMPDRTPPKNSLMWWEQFISREEPPGRIPIGSHNVRKAAQI